MNIFLYFSEQYSGPYSLEAVHGMKNLGSLPADTLAAFDRKDPWLPLDEFLALHPLPVAPKPAKSRATPPKPSRLRGLGGALLGGFVGGLVIAGITAVSGAFFTILWLPMGWAVGFLAAEWGRIDEDQVVGVFAVGGTLLGIFLSAAGLSAHRENVFILGPIGILGGFIGGIWAAFKAGSSR